MWKKTDSHSNNPALCSREILQKSTITHSTSHCTFRKNFALSWGKKKRICY